MLTYHAERDAIVVSEPVKQIELLKWISIADRYIKIEIDRLLKPYHLSSSNYYYLLRLKERPGITQEGLIDLMYLNRSNVTRSINQLVNLGIVRKEVVASDRRMSKLYLTDQGEKLCPIVAKVRQDAVGQAAASAGDQADLVVTAMRDIAKGAVAREQKTHQGEVSDA